MHLRSPLSRFIVRVLAWLPVTFAVWYFASPVLMWPVGWLTRWICQAGFADLVRGIEQARAGNYLGDISAAIEALVISPGSDLIQVQRLKKRKLVLRDKIRRIEDQLTPDIIA